MRYGLLLPALLLWASAAMAEAQTQAPDPCAHAGQTVLLGGMDMTVMRCRLALDLQRLAGLNDQLLGVATDLAIARNDLADERKEAQKQREALADWFKKCFEGGTFLGCGQ